MKRVILGTAGHIDHGKTTLVKALTGTDTDRLPEEKARGITIDLGFAHLQLGELNVGIVDVPGHEGLIRNMLAGATGFDAVMLVVAADEGVMPQTREHVAIARLLGVRRMVVAITKSDTVDAEWLELVHADVEAFVRTEMGNFPIVPVSAVTGAGLDTLQTLLVDQLSHGHARQDGDLFRMPIDRVFTIHGTGTVVTGTVWSGRAARHSPVRVLPAGRHARIRGVQTHGAHVESASAGDRAAFALAGIEREDLARGDVLVDDDAWLPTRSITARIQLLGEIGLKHRQRVRIHLGTAEVLGRVAQHDGGWVQVRLESPLVARAGDRFVIRSYSPVRTIGGGQVAELDRPRKRITSTELEFLTRLLDGDPAMRLVSAVELSESRGRSLAELPVTAGLTPDEVSVLAASLPSDVVRFGDRLYSTAVVARTIEQLCSQVDAFHAARPLEAGIERAVLLAPLAAELGSHALVTAEADGQLSSRGGLVARPGFEAGFSPVQKALRDRLLEQLRQAGLSPPSVPELTAAHRSNDVRAVLRLMEARGEVLAIHPDLYVDRHILAAALAGVRSGIGPGPLTAGEFKTVLPVSRKYLIPLLEYMDRIGVTKREGDLRRVVAVEPPETA